MKAIIIEDEAIASRRLKNLINEVSSDIVHYKNNFVCKLV